jgi:hypothetical protein
MLCFDARASVRSIVSTARAHIKEDPRNNWRCGLTLSETLVLIAAIYLISFVVAPFPHWPSFFKLWRYILFEREPAIPFHSRLRQGGYLLRHLLLNPFRTLFWYLDELLFPGYRKIRFEPVFIIGQARSGTTFLHRTLAHDEENFVAVRHLDWRYPYICLQKVFNWLGVAEKIAASNYWPDTEEGRAAAKMHPNTLADWEEDGIFYEEVFLHYWYLFMRFPYKDIAWHQEAFASLSERYQWHMLKSMQKAVQKVFYLRGAEGKLFLSKEVASHDKIEKMLELYPNARFVISVRNSEGYMSSLLALVRNSAATKVGVDPYTIPEWRETFVERMRRDTLVLIRLSREVIPEEQQVRVVFHHTTRRPRQVVRHIYETLNLDLGENYKHYLDELQERQEARDRGYKYDQGAFAGFEEHDAFYRQVSAEVDAVLGLAAPEVTEPESTGGMS